MSLKWLPNLVTILRCVLAIIVGYTILRFDQHVRAGDPVAAWTFIPFILFTITAATDWLDGALARGLDATSAFGARLDPIADKLLTASSLLALAHIENWSRFVMLPAIAIVGRDFLMTAIRESLGNPTSLKVSNAAKWKTALALVSIGALLLGLALSQMAADATRYAWDWLFSRGVLMAGLFGIWVTAILSVATATEYVKGLTSKTD